MDYEMNDYFFGYDQYEDLPATESFVEFNEELFPATEGFKDTVKKAATAAKNFIIRCANHLLSLLLKLARLVVNAIPHRETKERLKAKLTISINKCKDRIEKYKKNPSPTDNDAKQIVSEVKQATSVVASAKNEVKDPEVKKEIVETVKEMDNVSKEITSNKNTTEDSNNGEESKETDKRIDSNNSKKNVVDKNHRNTLNEKNKSELNKNKEKNKDEVVRSSDGTPLYIRKSNGDDIYYDSTGKNVESIYKANKEEIDYFPGTKKIKRRKNKNGAEITYYESGKPWKVKDKYGRVKVYYEDGRLQYTKDSKGNKRYAYPNGKGVSFINSPDGSRDAELENRWITKQIERENKMKQRKNK